MHVAKALGIECMYIEYHYNTSFVVQNTLCTQTCRIDILELLNCETAGDHESVASDYFTKLCNECNVKSDEFNEVAIVHNFDVSTEE